MSAEELKNRILTGDLDELLEQEILSGPSAHFPEECIVYVLEFISRKYAIEISREDVFVVGSAKIGFGLHEKRVGPTQRLPAFRSFSADSDIDVAFTCSKLFSLIWHELSKHAVSKPYAPWDSGKLGDYLVTGWLRPDHFPRNDRLRRCDDWKDSFRFLSRDIKLGRRQIRGALFASRHQLKMYQMRGLVNCKLRLET